MALTMQGIVGRLITRTKSGTRCLLHAVASTAAQNSASAASSQFFPGACNVAAVLCQHRLYALLRCLQLPGKWASAACLSLCFNYPPQALGQRESCKLYSVYERNFTGREIHLHVHDFSIFFTSIPHTSAR
jgi:hypothetical protein